MDRSVSESRKAEHYDQKAASVGKGGISSDDPEAIDKLKAKLAELQERQEYMKAANKEYRRCKGNVDAMVGVSDRMKGTIKRTLATFPWIKRPFTFEITNNGGNMKRIEQRIAQLEASANTKAQEWEFDGFTVHANPDENRLQIVFPGKPDAETRAKLKTNGFRWSPTNGAWQRHLNNAAIYHAGYAMGVDLV